MDKDLNSSSVHQWHPLSATSTEIGGICGGISKELGNIPRSLQTNDTFAKHLDDSIVKGVVQIYSLAHQLIQEPVEKIKNTKNFYGVVVCYREHYLKGGRDFWDEFLKEKVEIELKKANIDTDIIPPEHIFLISIDDFDYIIEFMNGHPDISLKAILDHARNREADPLTRSFFFEHYLRDLDVERSLKVPQYLRNRFLSLPDALIKRFEDVAPELVKNQRAAPKQ